MAVEAVELISPVMPRTATTLCRTGSSQSPLMVASSSPWSCASDPP